MKRILLLLTFFICCTAYQSSAQALSGVYTIDPAQPFAGTNYQTFNQAVSDLSTNGVAAAVTFNVAASNTFNEQVEIPQIVGASATNTITFNGNGSTLSFFSTTNSARYTLRLNNADYIKINNLVVDALGTTYAFGIHIYNDANYNHIDSCVINLPPNLTATSQVGIAISCSPTFSYLGSAPSSNNNTISYCTINNAYRGVTLSGRTSDTCQNNTLEHCKIKDFQYMGVYVAFQESALVQGNEFWRPTRTNIQIATWPSSISTATGVIATLINRNHIHDPNTSNPTLILGHSPISIQSVAYAGKENIVSNNLVDGMHLRGSVYGVSVSNNSDYVKVLHNTIILDDQQSSSWAMRGLSQYNTSPVSSIEFRNNNVFITHGGCLYGQTRYGIVIRSPNVVSDNNNVFLRGSAGNRYGSFALTPYTTLTDWQTANGGTFDQNSTDFNPNFRDSANGDYTPTNGLLNNSGTGTTITTDYNNASRSTTTPDVGAYEWSCNTLAGIYTINPSIPASATNFTSFGSAMGSLNCGINAPVIFNVAPGNTFNEQVEVYEIPGASATNTVTINGNGSTLSFSSCMVDFPHTIRLNGTDYLTINNLNIEALGTTYASTLHMWDGANHNEFDNCTFTSVPNNSSAGNYNIIITTQGSGLTPNSSFLACDYNSFSSCNIYNGRVGIILYGNTVDEATGNSIDSCNIQDFREGGVYIGDANMTTILANDISRPLRTSVLQFNGIHIRGGCINTLIEKNHIHNPFATNPNSNNVGDGIEVFTNSGSANNENRIINNLIEDFNGAGQLTGIVLLGDNVEVWHNTIAITGTQTGSGQVRGLYATASTASNLDIRNNNIVVTIAHTGTRTGIILSSASTTCDYNNVFLNTGFYGNYSGVYTTLANWQTANGGAFGQNSTSVDPQFVNPLINNYAPSNLAMDNIGAPLGVNDDIENTLRPAINPDAGAYEFACFGGSTTVTNFISVTDTIVSCFGSSDAQVNLQASAGSAPYSYNLYPGAISNANGIFTGLGIGTYSIVVNDAQSCADTISFNVTQPPALTISNVTPTNPSCTPNNNGSISVTVTGGTTAYQYRLNAGAYQAGNSFNTLTAGTYTITVRDANLCTASTTVNLVSPAVPVVTSVVDTNVLCFGGSTGSMQVNGTSANAINYTLNPGSVTNTSGYFNNLSQGSYTITLSDAVSSCTAVTIVNITQPASALMISNVTPTNPSCTPNNNGSISVTATGGTTAYQYRLNAGAYQAGNSFNTLTAGTYTITVRDANLCTASTTVNLVSPAVPLVTSVVDTNVLCFGGSTGSMQVNGTSANAINYTLNPGAVTNTSGYFNNLSQGSYTITLSDAVSSCTAVTTVNITEPTQLNIDSLTTTNPSCSPGNDGTIIVNAIGGTPTYMYNIGGANQASNSFASVASGTYTVTIIDANSCMDTMSVNLSAPNAPTITSTTDTSISCFNANDGSIQVTGTGATAITYTLMPGNVQNGSGYYNNLTANTYTITLSDASSCTVSTTVNISEPTQLNIDSLTTSNPSCSPGNDGTIIVNAVGGTPTYMYNIGGANQASNSFASVASGTYTVTIIDANSCMDTMSVNLSAPNAPTITSTTDTSISCFNANDGSLQVTGTGATAITYTLMPGNVQNGSGYYNNLTANTYTITLSDASSCTVSTTVNISEPSQLNIDSLTTTNPSCSPGNDGTIIVNAIGGTPTYMYNIGGANQVSNSFSSVASGTYTVTIIDANSCMDTMSVNLSAPNAPTITSTTDTSISCIGLNNGSLQVTGTGATAITYTLMPGNVQNGSGYYNNLTANTYTITLSDASSCTVSTTVNISEPTQLNIDSLTTSNPSCSPGNDGTIIVNAVGGTPTYMYNIGGANQASNSFASVASGTYTVTIIDANSCMDTMSVNLSAPNAPTITSTTDTSISCFNANDGSLQVTGTGATAITYTLMPGNVQNGSGYYNNLTANTYTITLSDASSCTVSTTVNISEPSQLNIDSLTTSNPSCSPGNDGTIIVNAVGGTPTYMYNIGGANQASNSFASVASGTYTVTIIDANSCMDTMSVNLSAPNAPTITSTTDTSISCFNANDGSLQVTGTGATAITYTLMPGNVQNGSGYYNNLTANTYTITLSDASSCTVSTTVNISEPSQLNIDSLTTTNPSCSPGNDGTIIVNAIGGTPTYMYNIGGANQVSNSFSSVASGTYTVTIIDANSCMDTMSVNLSAPNAPTITSTTDTSISCIGLNNGSLQVTGTGATAITYTLMPGNVQNGSGYYNNLTANTYTITLSDASSCTVSTTVNISEPTQLNIDSLTTSNPSCSPGNDGTIIVNAVGGTPTYMYNIGGANQASNSFASVASGTYTVTIIDANSCMDTMSVNLSAPNAPTITSTTDTSISCFNANDGSLQVTGTGATAITYTLMPGNVQNGSGYYNNLTANTYTITLSDASSCTVSTTVNISEPSQLNIDSLTTSNPSCSPGNDGTIIVNAVGGTPTYMYNIGGANQASNSFASVASGTYTVTIIDANSCMDTMSVNLSAPNAPTITSTTDTSISCFGLNNGSLQVTGTGASTITYTLMPGNVQNGSGYYNNLTANTYTITLSDASSCTVSTTVNITEPSQLNIDSLTTTNPSCSPGNDGTIIVNAVGGTPTYMYNIGGANQSSNSFSSVASGTYTVTIIDANSCMDTMSVNLLIPNAPIVISLVETNVSCNGVGDGSVQVAGTGFGSISYTLNPGAITNTSGYFTGLVPNTYTITLTDANNCTTTSTSMITEPSLLTIDSLNATNPSCNPGGDGMIIVNANGGTSPYQYSIGGANQVSNNFANLNGATYTVTVLDANNCSDTMSVSIIVPNNLTVISTTDTNISCNGLNDGIIAVVGGGSSNITYAISPGAAVNASGYFNNLSSNIYTITLSDGSSCSITTTANITEPTPLLIDSLQVTNVLCSGNTTGVINVFASGGNGGNTFTLNPGALSNNNGMFAGLSAQIYTITISDSNGCTTTAIDSVVEPLPILMSYVSDSVSCFGGNDGSLQVSIIGGISPYTFTLNPGANSNVTGFFDTLMAGVYSVNVVDANGCSNTLSNLNVYEPPALLFSNVNTTDVTCFGDNTGAVTVQVQGGTGNLNYSINPSVGSQPNANQFTQLTAGAYTITVSDANSCAQTTIINIGQNPLLEISSLNITEPTCHGVNDGALSFSATGGVGTLQYSFNGGAPSSTTSYSNLAGGSYTIQITDGLGCIKDTVLVLTEPTPISIQSLTITPTLCANSSDGQIDVQATGGNGNYIYYLRPGIRLNRTGLFTGLSQDLYSLRVKDTLGCSFDTLIPITPPANSLSVSIVKKDLGCFGFGTEGTAEAIVTGGLPPFTFLWSTTPVQNQSKAEGLRFGPYSVEVADENGCIVSASTYINPGLCCQEIFVPNAFSPNGDGNNDKYRVITTAGIELQQFEVYNRWGQRVWATYDYTSTWDGNFQGEPAATAVYYYVFKYKCLTDEREYIKKGEVTLIR